MSSAADLDRRLAKVREALADITEEQNEARELIDALQMHLTYSIFFNLAFVLLALVLATAFWIST